MMVEKYQIYREACTKLVTSKTMFSGISREAMMKSAKLLGIAQGDTLVFDREEEINVLADFALHEYKVSNKNAVQIYREKVPCNEIERDIRDALLSSTSLSKVISISTEESSLLLADLLNQGENIKLIDINLSKTAIPGLLLFTRILPFENFQMTSGLIFIFRGDYEEYLFKKYRKLSKRVATDSESLRRFVSFFWLSKTDGLEVRYE